MTANIPALRDDVAHQIFGLLEDRQRKGAILAEPPYAVGSSVGSVRSQNQDVGLILRIRHATNADRDLDLGLVCDGMGGLADGRLAAQLAASVFVSGMIQPNKNMPTLDRMRAGIFSAQNAVQETLRGTGGTTLSAIAIERNGRSWLAHVGDSRIYAVGAEGELDQLTRDDTLGAALNRVDEGHADFHRLIQFVGMTLERGDILEPQLVPVSISSELQGFVVTSDGAHHAPKDVLHRLSAHSRNGPEMVKKLLNLADVLGGLDNATAAFLPFRPAPLSGVPQSGMIVSLLTTSGDMQVWIPSRDSFGNRQDPPMVSEPRTIQPAPFEPAMEGSPKVFHQGPVPTTKAKPKKTSRKRPKKTSEPALPLDAERPVVEIHFPDDDER